MMDNEGWIKIQPGGPMPNNCERVEIKHVLFNHPLDVFYLEGHPIWPTKFATHWRRLTWHFAPLPVEEVRRELE